MGNYDEKKFIPFLDHTRMLFNFNIHYIQEEIPFNTPGGIFYYQKKIIQDNP